MRATNTATATLQCRFVSSRDVLNRMLDINVSSLVLKGSKLELSIEDARALKAELAFQLQEHAAYQKQNAQVTATPAVRARPQAVPAPAAKSAKSAKRTPDIPKPKGRGPGVPQATKDAIVAIWRQDPNIKYTVVAAKFRVPENTVSKLLRAHGALPRRIHGAKQDA